MPSRVPSLPLFSWKISDNRQILGQTFCVCVVLALEPAANVLIITLRRDAPEDSRQRHRTYRPPLCPIHVRPLRAPQASSLKPQASSPSALCAHQDRWPGRLTKPSRLRGALKRAAHRWIEFSKNKFPLLPRGSGGHHVPMVGRGTKQRSLHPTVRVRTKTVIQLSRIALQIQT